MLRPLILACLLAWPAHAEDTWSTTSDRPYDLIANCLMTQMAPLYHSYPLVSAPPRRDAKMLMWVRGREHLDPLAWFTIDPLPTPMGGSAVKFYAPTRFPHFEQAKQSGKWCSLFAI